MKAFDYIDGWNEDEYKFLFISPLLNFIDFFNEYYSVFTQRPMSVQYDNGTKTTSGKVEWMLARGRQTPKQPHFFLHEYKPEKNRDNDPLGQLLIAMVAAVRRIKARNQFMVFTSTGATGFLSHLRVLRMLQVLLMILLPMKFLMFLLF